MFFHDGVPFYPDTKFPDVKNKYLDNSDSLRYNIEILNILMSRHIETKGD